MDNIKLTISCITYNQVDILPKTLDGFLMQKTNFEYQIVVHDDCSNDGTAEVLRDYEKKYSNIIALYEKENQYSQGNPLGPIMSPYYKGEYIAICEGDDYWTDPYKLQKQVDFMDKNFDVMLCVHAAEHLNLKTMNSSIQPPNMVESRFISMDEIIEYGGGFFPTCSFIRRSNLEIIPNRWGKGICGDFNNILSAGLVGKVYYMSDVMAVKTIFHKSSWSTTHSDPILMKKHKLNEIESINMFNKDTGYKYDLPVQKRLMMLRYQLKCELEGDYKLLFKDEYFRKVFKQLSKTKKIRSILLAYFPALYKLYYIVKKIRGRA